MPSSTSSSEKAAVDRHHAASDVVERAVPALGRAGWLALAVFLAGMAAMEAWVRAEGVPSGDYRSSPGLWAEQRRRIDRGEGDAWVFTGASRIYYDVQLPVWTKLDGRAPIQLAVEGTTPLRVMEGLAEDEDFTGTLVIGVAPGIFFSGFEYQGAEIDSYTDETPSQWLGHKISKVFEPWLAFYDPDYALPAILRRQPFPDREGVKDWPDVRKLATYTRERNARLWKRLEEDPEYAQYAQWVWATEFEDMDEPPPPEEVERMMKVQAEQIDRAVAATEKLVAKGARVVFAMLPFEGVYAEWMPKLLPREETWDVLIERTGALGLHFEDHPEMQGYWLPEWSHMSRADADRFTEAFHGLLQRELARHQAAGGSS
jgi:hypothetical protein